MTNTQANMTGAFSPERDGYAVTHIDNDTDNGNGPGLGGDPVA
jgi:hypothetical protein